MKILGLTTITCLLFDATPSDSIKWRHTSNGCELRSRSFSYLSQQTFDNSYTQSTFALKAAANQKSLAKYGTQVYGVATYDALFKWILDDPKIRPSFFHAFTGINVTSSERLDESMNPLQELQLLRKFINNNDTQKTVDSLQKSSKLEVRIKKTNPTRYKEYPKGTDFLNELVSYFGDIVNAFPIENYDGSMDFVCRLNTGEYALVETQIVRQDYWDMRALAYIAAFYGNQIRKGGKWKDIKKVIGINILGGGIEPQNPWKDAPGEFVRHYRVQEQINIPTRFIEGLELYQYSLANIKQNGLTQEQSDWLKFLREGHKMTEIDVAQIQTPAVRCAFERAKLNQLTQTQLDAYFNEASRYRNIDGVIQEAKIEGRVEGEKKRNREIALKMLLKNKNDDEILELLSFTLEELNELKKELKS